MALALRLVPAPVGHHRPRPPPLRRPTPTFFSPGSRSQSLSDRRSASCRGFNAATETFLDIARSSSPTWQSAALSNLAIFLLGSPILAAGLTVPGIGSAYLLGVLTWRAFGPAGFLLVALYFVVGTAATKLKITQKESQGVAEKRNGRRGPESVIGSSAAACVCALLSIFGVGGDAFIRVWQLGFVASFCTKLSDTISSEVGKAYGKTTYLVTTLKAVPRGSEGAVSIEGTIAGLLASILLATAGYFMAEVDMQGAVLCVLASQIANFWESLIGATLQDKEGYRWLNNDVVNVINVSIGSILAILALELLQKGWH